MVGGVQIMRVCASGTFIRRAVLCKIKEEMSLNGHISFKLAYYDGNCNIRVLAGVF